ncbi:type II secretion system protein [Pseudoduganella sp. S-14]|jgi:general secretion pathway protein G|uniref:type II secretion system protein n=1 Tax=Pseudoduganella sp. S-14 TaxID=3404065 RepID=UPI003CF408BF
MVNTSHTARQGAFTLVELLTVLAIIAVLLTVALPRYLGSVDRSREVALKENLKVLRASLDKHHADYGRYPDSLEQLVERRYLRAVPVDPVTDSAMTWVTLPARDPGEQGIGDVRSGAGGAAKDGTPYESF